MRNPRLNCFAAALGFLVLGACGGGGGGGSGGGTTPPPANRSPAFTSPATANVNENVTGTVYTAAASDPDGDPVTFAFVAGGDEGVFVLNSATGAVSLAAGLDFESPQDANRDNLYSITLEARDNRGASARLVVAITVVNQAEAMALRRVGAGFSQPLYLAGIPGTDQVVVVQKEGRIRVLTPATGAIASVDFLDLTGQVAIDSERGLLGLAFSPNFATDRTFYINVSNLAGDNEIRRYRMMTGSNTQADPATADVILVLVQPAFGNHKAGWIGFANSGLLYVPTGDGGSGGDPLNNAQNPNSLLGKVLRLDVSGDDFPADANRDYRIPAGNAFPGGTAGAPEIFALGLRNPFRASVDGLTGDLLIGDVGQNAIEEVDRLRPGDAGANFGWRLREGTQAYNGGADSAAFTLPVAEYGHGTGPTQGRSVTGGYIYRGNVEGIRNNYVFGDFVSGNVWAVPATSLVPGQTVAASAFTRLNTLLVPDAGTLSQISSFGLDTQGRLHIVTFGGDVFRIDNAP
jgi:glucose/arabinose dehydrogenase